MKTPIRIGVALIATACLAYAGMRCYSCKGTGWNGNFRCLICGGDGETGN